MMQPVMKSLTSMLGLFCLFPLSQAAEGDSSRLPEPASLETDQSEEAFDPFRWVDSDDSEPLSEPTIVASSPIPEATLFLDDSTPEHGFGVSVKQVPDSSDDVVRFLITLVNYHEDEVFLETKDVDDVSVSASSSGESFGSAYFDIATDIPIFPHATERFKRLKAAGRGPQDELVNCGCGTASYMARVKLKSGLAFDKCGLGLTLRGFFRSTGEEFAVDIALEIEPGETEGEWKVTLRE